MTTCKRSTCNNTTNGSLLYCEKCFAEWRNMKEAEETWHPDATVTELRRIRSLLHRIEKNLEDDARLS